MFLDSFGLALSRGYSTDVVFPWCAFGMQCFVGIFINIEFKEGLDSEESMLGWELLLAVLMRSDTRHAYAVKNLNRKTSS